MLFAAMAWFVIMLIIVVLSKTHIKWSEWAVGVVLWGITIAVCGAVQFDWWPEFQPLGWLSILFEPPTRWVIGRV